MLRKIFCLSLWASSAFAQSDFTTEEIHTRVQEKLPISASVFSGMKSNYHLLRSDRGKNISFGPFVRPEIEYRVRERQKYYFSLSYRFTASSEEIFGNTLNSKEITDNSVFIHQPAITASVHLSPDFSAGVSGILGMTTYVGDQKKNTQSIFLRPKIEYELTSTDAISLGYIYDRLTNFDTTLQEVFETNSASDQIAKENLLRDTAKPISNPNQEPTKTLHAAELGYRHEFDESIHFKAAVIVGRNLTNSSGGSYRNAARLEMGSHMGKLNLKSLYQFTADVKSVESGKVGYTNMIRFLLAYSIAEKWFANLEDNFGAMTGLPGPRFGQKDRSKIQNEQYIGVSYAF